MNTNINDCNTGLSALSPTTICVEALASVVGGYRLNETIDNANRWGNTGALIGAGIGVAVGGPVGATIVGAAGGGIGWLAGAIADSSHQVNAGKPNRPTDFGHWALH